MSEIEAYTPLPWREPKRKARAPLDERDANILRDIRAKLKTVADGYDIEPDYVAGVLLRAMEKSDVR